MNIVVIDGMGGGVGSRLVNLLKEELPPHIEIMALGTNAIATAAMLKKGANKGATGENALVVNVEKADIIVGALSILIPNEMFGEVTTKMVEAISKSDALKILIPMMPDRYHIVALEDKPLLLQLKEAVDCIKRELKLG